jgi:predicted transcriptional regulator
MRQIEIDERTANTLEDVASARGLSISELLAGWALDAASETQDIAELDRRWERAQAAGAVSNSHVIEWLETWGRTDFQPFAGR